MSSKQYHLQPFIICGDDQVKSESHNLLILFKSYFLYEIMAFKLIEKALLTGVLLETVAIGHPLPPVVD